VPRGVRSAGTVAIIRRVLDAGTIVRGVTDSGSQFGVVPSNLSDWSQLQALWGMYRLLRVSNHFMIDGDFDTTPAYPTLWAYHDYASLGAPANLSQAFLKRGVKALSFNAANTKRTFSLVPMVWTSSTFATQVPSPQMWYQTASAFAPSFSSISVWGQNYNSTVGTPGLRLLQEMQIEFREPN